MRVENVQNGDLIRLDPVPHLLRLHPPFWRSFWGSLGVPVYIRRRVTIVDLLSCFRSPSLYTRVLLVRLPSPLPLPDSPTGDPVLPGWKWVRKTCLPLLVEWDKTKTFRPIIPIRITSGYRHPSSVLFTFDLIIYISFIMSYAHSG